MYRKPVWQAKKTKGTPDTFIHTQGIRVHGENTTFGEIEAARWSSLLSYLESVSNQIVYSIKAEIKRYIVSCQKRADDERARNQLFR